MLFRQIEATDAAIDTRDYSSKARDLPYSIIPMPCATVLRSVQSNTLFGKKRGKLEIIELKLAQSLNKT